MRGIEPVSVVDAVCEAFVHDLLSDLYQPGSGFTELDVAERYGVARPTAREAITRLASQGFLVRQPNRTAIYPRLQATDLRELVVVRLALEEAAVRAPVRQNEFLDLMESETPVSFENSPLAIESELLMKTSSHQPIFVLPLL